VGSTEESTPAEEGSTEENSLAEDDTPNIPTGEYPDYTAQYTEVQCGELLPQRFVDEYFLGEPSVECGQVTVPADWTEPDGGTVKIAVYRIPSTNNSPAADPVVFLAGGPGGSGVNSVNDFSVGKASYLRDRSDILVVDQRGTGYSDPALYCSEIFTTPSPAGYQDDEIRTQHYQEMHQACVDRLAGEGVDLADYNSTYTALDFDAVRMALGYEEWNLYGVSYGTRLALTLMREKPEHIRSVVLDSVIPVEINGMSEGDYPYYWAIEQIAVNCAADDDCTDKVGNIKEVIEAGIARLDANPVGQVSANLYLYDLSNVASPDLAAYTLLIANGTYDDINQDFEDKYGVPADYVFPEPTEEVDLSNPNADTPAEAYPFGFPAHATAKAIICSEEAAYADIMTGPDISSQFNETSQRVITDRMNRDWALDYTLCDNVYSVPARGLIETQAVESDIPTLVLAGTADSITPPTWSLQVADTLSNAQYAEFPGLNHALLGNDFCTSTITDMFIYNPTMDVDQSCILDMDGVDYVFP